jgi:uncharacterized protein (TIGR03083 family)
MTSPFEELQRSSQHLRDLVVPLDDEQLEQSAYPTEWAIADVLSHIGSGGVIMERRLEDALAGEDFPDDFAPQVWETWNAKSPRDQADHALASDAELVDRLMALTDTERARVKLSFGPLTLDADSFVALRLNEHVLHTWDVEVALDDKAELPPSAVAVVVDNLDLIARFTAKPTGAERRIVIRTTDPARTFAVTLSADEVGFEPASTDAPVDLELPAEALIRLVYGRLDPQHTPAFTGDAATLDELRRVYPGP